MIIMSTRKKEEKQGIKEKKREKKGRNKIISRGEDESEMSGKANTDERRNEKNEG